MSVELLPKMDHESRLEKLRSAAELGSSQAFYISALSNIRYLTGFSGSAGLLLVFAESAALLVDGRYTESASVDVSVPGLDVVAVESGKQLDSVAHFLGDSSEVILDPAQITVDVHAQLQQSLPGSIIYRRGLPERLRLSKDDAELWRIRAAAKISIAAFHDSVPLLESEPTEKEFATALEARMKELGADSIGFSTIVASGPNSSKPHISPTDRRIREGEPVVVDFGATIDGYHSDTARTVWFGDLDSAVKPIYAAAMAAHDAGIQSATVGSTHADIDARCRSIIADLGYSGKPLHPSGHNVGLDIHERPFLSPYAMELVGDSFVLAVEPGVYVPGVGGCRIEDMVLVSAEGPKILAKEENR